MTGATALHEGRTHPHICSADDPVRGSSSSMTQSTSQRRKAATVFAAAVMALSLLGSAPADARAGGGFSFGSRGGRTFSAPASTNTWRGQTSPFQWSEQQRSASPFGAGAQPRRFGFGSGLAAGLLGAGLLGMLTGNGFFGGLGGVASLFGLLFQLVLVGGLVSLLLGFFRNRFAGPAAGFGPGGGARPGFGPPSGFPGPGGGAAPLNLTPQDFGAFERLLGEVQSAYGREDTGALSRLATPEVVRYFASDLEDNRRRGVRNEITDVRLLQGDLSESWREGRTDFATVAMRFAGRDVMLDRGTGKVVAGDPQRPVEATEVWTFRRDGGGPWLLSGVQQTS